MVSGPVGQKRSAPADSRRGLATLLATSGATNASSFGRLGLASLRLAWLRVPAILAHVGQDARALNLAPELPESLLQILALRNLDLQRSVSLVSCTAFAPLVARSIQASKDSAMMARISRAEFRRLLERYRAAL